MLRTHNLRKQQIQVNMQIITLVMLIPLFFDRSIPELAFTSPFCSPHTSCPAISTSSDSTATFKPN
ncbi:hypothetical protein HanIR_Chr05g0209511 [Helianthus annuus]|nr:hypothetical protein HanIR_Chr05g0209511 [Helianthus annuus]